MEEDLPWFPLHQPIPERGWPNHVHVGSFTI